MNHNSHVERYKSFMLVNFIEQLYGRKVKKISFDFH